MRDRPGRWFARVVDYVSRQPAREVVGHVDRVSEGIVEGWAASARADVAISIDIEIDGIVTCRGVVPEIYRPDVAYAGFGDGPHGFATEVPGAKLDSNVRLLTSSGRVIASYGRKKIRASRALASAEDDADARSVASVIAPHLDAAFYSAQFEKEFSGDDDPVIHYIQTGWSEGRDPTPEFSTRFYLETYPDVANAGVNPFWHFIVAGRDEGRVGKGLEESTARHLAQLASLEERKRRWMRPEPAPDTASSAALEDAFLRASGRARSWIISLTHDDFRLNSGGVQLCASIEQAAAIEAGHAYLALFPWQALPTITECDDPELVGVLLNGELVGHAPLDRISAAFCKIVEGDKDVHLVVHSMLGFAPERVVAFARDTSAKAVLYWLHDFLWLCSGFTLRRNDLNYCGAPPSDSMACGVCIYGQSRHAHLQRMHYLFAELPVTVVSPSQFMADFWHAHSPHSAKKVLVQPHLGLGSPEPRSGEPRRKSHKLRIAFIGAASQQKGWTEFMRLVKDRRAATHASFYHFGVDAIHDPRIEHQAVRVSSDNRTAMRDALREAQIDVALHWSHGPETFSFAAHEALAAGAIVVTSPVSGNIAALARECSSVIVHDDPETLGEAVLVGSIAQHLHSHTRHPRQIRFSRMSIDALDVLGALA